MLLKDMLKDVSGVSAVKGGYVEFGYGQIEPNHLSAQRTGQIYAQLPANKNIQLLENGQFVKYDYAAGDIGEVDFVGKGEWMLVYNEIKLYRDEQLDCEFAMRKDDYQARYYSPYDGQPMKDKQSRYLNGKDAEGHTSMTITDSQGVQHTYEYDDVTAGPDIRELFYEEDPLHFLGKYDARKMPSGTTMVPRVLKTNVGDIFTTNTIAEATLAVGDVLSPRATDGMLSKTGDGSIQWQVVKVYEMPDHQKGVKVMRIA